jgi:hypothetical protein
VKIEERIQLTEDRRRNDGMLENEETEDSIQKTEEKFKAITKARKLESTKNARVFKKPPLLSCLRPFVVGGLLLFILSSVCCILMLTDN